VAEAAEEVLTPVEVDFLVEVVEVLAVIGVDFQVVEAVASEVIEAAVAAVSAEVTEVDSEVAEVAEEVVLTPAEAAGEDSAAVEAVAKVVAGEADNPKADHHKTVKI